MVRDSNWRADAPTLVAIAVVVNVLATILHEGVGHGGACLLTGGKPLVLSSVHFECDDAGLTPAGRLLLEAGGTLVNFIAGFLCFVLARLARYASVHVRYFLWLLMTVNLFQAGGYFLFSGVANIGDWAAIIRGLAPAWAWRAGLAAGGAILYLSFVRLSLGEMGPFIGGDEERVSRARKLALVPYFAGGVISCVAGLFNPVGMILVAISAAAASFGGTSGLAWMTDWLRGGRVSRAPGPPLPIDRRWTWIVAGTVLGVLFIAILGPGVRFR